MQKKKKLENHFIKKTLALLLGHEATTANEQHPEQAWKEALLYKWTTLV